MRVILIVVLFLFAAHVEAAPITLVEVTGDWEAGFGHSFVPTIATFKVIAGEQWNIDTMIDDAGRTFVAPSSVVDAANMAFQHPDGGITHGINVHTASESFHADWATIFRGYNTPRLSGRAFAPQLGPGLSGYRVTSIEQTINRWIPPIPGNPGRWSHTVRIIGEQVPEPATIALAFLIHSMGLFVRLR